jgi:nitrate reductase (NAD(P)H)
MIKQTIGFNWGAAGVSTGVWTGARLSDILRLAGITSCVEGMHVRFASENGLGGDKLPGGVYGTSIPMMKAMDDSQDVIVAYMYNGQFLSVDHGFPVRLIIPGYIGGRMIKWLTNIDVQPTESQDYYHFFDNRVLPPHVDAETAKSEGWWFKPEYICNDLSVNSAISTPDHEEILPIEDLTAPYTLKGYSYAGGGRRITRVEISFDSGANWNLCDITIFEKPNAYGKYWTWIFWEYKTIVKSLATASEVVLRAWDEGHNTQPDKPTWNLMGMLNNPWFRIKIHPTESAGTKGVIFEHPTLAGNQNGGWMMRLKGDPSLTAPLVQHVETKGVYVGAVEEKIERAPVVIDTSKPSFTMDEVKKHNTAESSWFVVNNKVYDGTPFLKNHPGGADSIILASGVDSTEEFEAIHSKKAWKQLETYYIGELRASLDPSHDIASDTTSEEDTDEIALNPRKRIPFKLIVKEKLSPDSYRLRFALQSPSRVLGLPVGQHMLFSAKIDGKMVMRAYTPTSSDHDVGYFDLVIKVYYANVSKEYPEGGKMSQYLGAMEVGDFIEVKGPMGHVTYVSRGVLRLDSAEYPVKRFSMLCGGTGITPIYQVLCAVLRDPEDTTELHVLYSNRREEDVLLRPELDALAVAHPNRLFLHYTLSNPPESFAHRKGRVDAAMIRECLPLGAKDTFALLCGPPGMLDVCTEALTSLGYEKENCVYF